MYDSGSSVLITSSSAFPHIDLVRLHRAADRVEEVHKTLWNDISKASNKVSDFFTW